MSKQAWGIVPKVREVDALLREDAKLAVRVFLYDAFAALWTARRILTKKSRAIPSTSASDANGLPMRIAV